MILRVDDLEQLLVARYRALDEEEGLDFAATERLALQLARGDADADAHTVARAELLTEPGMAEVLLDYAASEPPAAPPRARWVAPAVTTLALAALVLFALWRPAGVLEPAEPSSVLTPKGVTLEVSDRLAVAAERQGRTWRVRPAETLQTGDGIGVFYSTPSESWLLVAHVDAAGDVTWLAPSDGVSTAQQPPGRDVPLPTGAQLTEAAGCQWFVAVFSDDALEPAMVAPALTKAALASRDCELEVVLPQARSVRLLGIRR